MTNILRNGINTLDELAPRWSIRRLESGRPWIEWATMLPAALAAAVAFPTLLQGILHLPSLSLIVMLIVNPPNQASIFSAYFVLASYIWYRIFHKFGYNFLHYHLQ
jgi:hypothetical protein